MNISLILLASGDSRRFGSAKLFHTIDGVPIYRHALSIIKDVPFSEKIVIAQHEEILHTCENSGFVPVQNNHSTRGISYSIRLGVESASPLSHAYCFMVCDQPYLKTSTLAGFVSGYIKSKKLLGSISCDDTLFTPNIFDSTYKNELLKLHGDTGGKSILRKENPHNIYRHEVLNEKELWDIDTPSDLNKLYI